MHILAGYLWCQIVPVDKNCNSDRIAKSSLCTILSMTELQERDDHRRWSITCTQLQATHLSCYHLSFSLCQSATKIALATRFARSSLKSKWPRGMS